MMVPHHFMQKAKTSNAETLGYDIINKGSHITIKIIETGDVSEAFLGDNPLAWFLMGVLMERHRAEKSIVKPAPRKKQSAKKTEVQMPASNTG